MALAEYAIYEMNFWMLDVCKMLLKHKEEDIERNCRIDSSEQHHNYWWPSLSDMGYKNGLKCSAAILIIYLIKMQQKWVTAHRTISDSQRQAIEKNITFWASYNNLFTMTSTTTSVLLSPHRLNSCQSTVLTNSSATWRMIGKDLATYLKQWVQRN